MLAWQYREGWIILPLQSFFSIVLCSVCSLQSCITEALAALLLCSKVQEQAPHGKSLCLQGVSDLYLIPILKSLKIKARHTEYFSRKRPMASYHFFLLKGVTLHLNWSQHGITPHQFYILHGLSRRNQLNMGS